MAASAGTYLIANHYKHDCNHNGKGLGGRQVKSKEGSSDTCQPSCLHTSMQSLSLCSV